MWVIPLLVYVGSWSGWFFSDKGWSRDYSTNPLLSWIHYHREMLNFHTGLTTEHSYEASAWNWLILGRPTSFFYATPKSCGASSCSQEVLAIGTPLLWWIGLIALFVTLGYFIHRRERSAGLILMFWLASYLPWLGFPDRTMFFFYAIAFQPFMILGIIYTAQKALEIDESRVERQRYLLGLIALIALCFAYFFPLFVGSHDIRRLVCADVVFELDLVTHLRRADREPVLRFHLLELDRISDLLLAPSLRAKLFPAPHSMRQVWSNQSPDVEQRLLVQTHNSEME